MAKIAFSKLGLKKNEETVNFSIGNFTIEVKQYLPAEQKLQIIVDSLISAYDGGEFVNGLKLSLFLELNIIYQYTNISFTDKQKDDFLKTYDLLNGNGIIKAVIETIPEEEYNALYHGTFSFAENFFKQRNSAQGILQKITEEFDQEKFNVEEIFNMLKDPENLKLTKDILTKLG